MPILIHNNPQYIERLKAKRISDKERSCEHKQLSRQLDVPKGLVTRYNNGSNTRKYN